MFRLLIVCAELGVIKAEGLKNPNRGRIFGEHFSASRKSLCKNHSHDLSELNCSWTVSFDSLVQGGPAIHNRLSEMTQMSIPQRYWICYKQCGCCTELEILYAEGLENATYKQWCFQLWREIPFCQRRGTSPQDALLHQVCAWTLEVSDLETDHASLGLHFGLLQQWCDG